MKLFSWLFSIDRFGRENPDYSKNPDLEIWKKWIASKNNENRNGIFWNIHVDFCFFLLDASIFMSLAPFHGTNAGYMAVSHPFLCCSHFLKDDMKNRGGLELPKWFLLWFFGPKNYEATKKTWCFANPQSYIFCEFLTIIFVRSRTPSSMSPGCWVWGQMQAIP